MRITILIPTRERARTLGATLRTCTTQDYGDLEIVISDNCSQDETRSVVESASDPRIRYVNTGERVSMTASWEYALSQVREGMVMVLGDDDGLIPGAIADLAEITRTMGSDAVSWLKAEYCWPDHPVSSYRNRLILPLANKLMRMPVAKVRRDVCRLWLPYNRAPSLYNSIVSTSAIERARGKDGRFFRPFAPDIYSGIALLSALPWYLYSTRPFSLNGASSASTGTTTYRHRDDRRPLEVFMAEHNHEVPPVFRHVTGSVNSVVAEAIYQADTHVFAGSLRPNDWLIFPRIVADLKSKSQEEFESVMPELMDLAIKRGMWAYVRLCLAMVPRRVPSQPHIPLGLDGRLLLTLDCGAFSISDVTRAAMLAGNLLGPYQRPQYLGKYSFWSRPVSWLRRWFSQG